jgi:hypothetical protein
MSGVRTEGGRVLRRLRVRATAAIAERVLAVGWGQESAEIVGASDHTVDRR